MDSLTENAVLHISAGFDGPFTLQIFGLRKHPDFSSFADMCLTDGNVYIGAFYDGPDANELKNYALVRITAKFEDRFHPMYLSLIQHNPQSRHCRPCHTTPWQPTLHTIGLSQSLDSKK